MPSPKLEPLVLSDKERTTLEQWARRPKTSQRLAVRSRIVLTCCEGLSNTAAAEKLDLEIGTVRKWRTRFLKDRLDGLIDAPRPGAPRTIGDLDVERVLTKTLESKPENATHWSTRGMAEAVGLSQSAVSRIWRAFALQPPAARLSSCRKIRCSSKRCATWWACT